MAKDCQTMFNWRIANIFEAGYNVYKMHDSLNVYMVS